MNKTLLKIILCFPSFSSLGKFGTSISIGPSKLKKKKNYINLSFFHPVKIMSTVRKIINSHSKWL